MSDVLGIFGSMVFDDGAMKERLSADVYKAVKQTMQSKGASLELDVANFVAVAMKNWAIERGATHFTHWFQPMTGVTAEKHEGFIARDGDGAIMAFSGKNLVKGEPDASSFPSGGLRCTFEARGYTIWDTTSYAFIKDGTLCIPTAFCSYTGEVLDMKTPLLRSMEAINAQALRILRLFGNKTAGHVVAEVGPEQEYFLVDKSVFLKRPDLINCGRTLIGSRPPKGQEMEDHYYGSLNPRVVAFMQELDCELWKLGIYAKTKHKEVAPGQHELAILHTTANIATDHNQLTMELIKSVANRHNLAALLHEKPFAGVNGSGKHNNWSLATDTGINLLDPGDAPHENAQFLLFLAAVIWAVDEYQDLLRTTCARPGNDHRLGGHEAPPAIISMFLGSELTAILDTLLAGDEIGAVERSEMEVEATMLPHFLKDTTDRNRTSPMAFTGNKFEFRMPGSSLSVSGPNIVLNTAVAEALRIFADGLSNSADVKNDAMALVRKTYREHKRIVFNGDNYSDEWAKLAAERGLSNHKNTVAALSALIDEKNINLYTRHHIFNEAELHSRYEILMENYSKIINIEAMTMIDMIKTDIMPACVNYQNDLAGLLSNKRALGGVFDTALEMHLLKKTSTLSADLLKNLDGLEAALAKAEGEADIPKAARLYCDGVFAAMADARQTADNLESTLGKKHWPYPNYAAIFASI